MAIKCSLLGHKFSGTEVEEEREEQGSEVVITIEEVEVCERCGKRRVVSENKEVTSLAASEEESDAAADPAPASAQEPEPDEPEAAETDAQAPPPSPDMSAAEDDAELLDAGGDGADTTTDDESAPEPEPEPDIATAGETGVEDEPTAEDDGAVILDDDEEPEREPGEWPEDEGAPEAESEPAPETIEQAAPEAVEDSEDPEPAAEQAETEEWPDEYGYEEESAKAPEVDWPEEDEGDGEDWEPGESLTQRIDSDVEPAGAATVTVPEGEFYCPECEFTTLVEESSLRAGDFCPSCHRGSLEHRAEDATRKE